MLAAIQARTWATVPCGCLRGTSLVLSGDDGGSRSPHCCEHRVTLWSPCDKALRARGGRVPSHPPCLLPFSQGRLLRVGLAFDLFSSHQLHPQPPSRTPAQDTGAVPTRAAPQTSPPLPPFPCPGCQWQGPVPEGVFLLLALCDDLLARQRCWHLCLPTAEHLLNARLMNRGEHCQLLKTKGTRRYCCRQEYHQLH